MKLRDAEHGPVRESKGLVMFPGGLGDFICFLPALERIAEKSPVDVLARSEFSPLVPPGAAMGSLERPEVRSLFVAGGGQDLGFRKFFERYEHVYSWFGSGQPVFRQALQSATRGRARLFAFRPADQPMHQVDYYLSCVDGHRGPGRPAVRLTPQRVAWSRAYWEQNSLAGVPVLAIAPGSGARGKNWPVGAFATVAHWWRESVGGAVIVILGPVEEERGGYALLYGSGVLVARGLDLDHLAGILARSTLYLGNDSGTSHLAAAVGATTVVLFGPSDMLQWAPRGANVSILSRRLECSPCITAAMQACAHRKCLTDLPPQMVISTLQQLPAVATLTRIGAGIRVNPAISPESVGSIDD